MISRSIDRMAFGLALLLSALAGCAIQPQQAAAPSQPASGMAGAGGGDCAGAAPAGTLVSAQGFVTLRSAGQSAGPSTVAPAGLTVERRALLQQTLCQGDTVRTGARSRAGLLLANGALVRLDHLSTLTVVLVSADPAQISQLDLPAGKLQSLSRKPTRFNVSMPTAVIGVRGTEFVLDAAAAAASVTVFEGEIEARNDVGSVAVAAGSTAVIRAGQAPAARTLVRPRDQVQWALYFPPLFSFNSPGSSAGGGDASFAAAAACAAKGDMACAFDALDNVPEGNRSHGYHTMNAALLLAVGQIDDARAAIEKATAIEPRNGAGLALRAVIDVVTGDVAAALREATEAVARSPNDAGPRVALSYAQQAALDLEGAHATLAAAAAQHPDDALVRARLAEVLLSQGRSRAADAEATAAVRLAPELSRTQLVLGYVALARMELTVAEAAFARAVALDSADPLGRLGMGLVKVRRGALAAGRADIETAVALSSNDSVLRAYLGKSYFEEQRPPLAGEQYAIGRSLDPNDPTSYLYEGILDQSINRPVEGLQNLVESMARNDNRAVYRSRLLLDQDRAARGTSQARIYNSLGFQTLGIEAATASLTVDPANAGAHRFLSDSYRAEPRREVARVSELLQAQLLQDTNISPTQPSVSSTSLNIGTNGGPTSSGFSEFNALFERDRAAFNATGSFGNDGLRNGEAVVSGVYEKFSGSAGIYRYDSDGFRDNNDLKHDIKDVYVQMAATPELNLQAEFRDRTTKRGDLAMNFDPQAFDPNLREEVDDRNGRLGLRFSPNERTTLLLSYLRSEHKVHNASSVHFVDVYEFQPEPDPPDADPPEPFFITATTDIRQDTVLQDKTDHYGALGIYKGDRFNATGGVEIAKSHTRGQLTSTRTDVCVPQGDPDCLNETSVEAFPMDTDTDDHRAYAYANIDLLPALVATVGASYQDIDSNVTKFHRINPKLGLQWDATQHLRLRAAYFEAVKPLLAGNRTLEPSQVAGFNQLFDESNSTRSATRAAAVDWAPLPGLFVGVEGNTRSLEHAELSANGATFEDREDETARTYLHWTPMAMLALRVEVVFDRFKKDQPSTNANGIDVLKTFSVPASLSFFHPNGFFATLGATYVYQRREMSFLLPGAGTFIALPADHTHFTTVDLGLGYRLPRRLGIVSLLMRNAFDKKLSYQDDTFRSFQDEPAGTPFVPERTVMGTFTLSL